LPLLKQSDTARIVDSVVRAVEQSPLENSPFHHFRMINIFPPDVYQRMITNLPVREAYHDLRHKDADLPDGTSTRKMFEFFEEQFVKLPQEQLGIWAGIRDALYDDRVRRAIFFKLRVPIESRLGCENKTLALRGNSWEDVEAYPRPALYRDEAGYKITPHPDSPLKIATVQFYLPTNDSQRNLGTFLYRPRGWLERIAAPWAGKFKTVKQFDFLPNSGYAFGVTTDSFHGRPPISGKAGLRHSILLFYLREEVKLTY
jgi:hypothetical protein